MIFNGIWQNRNSGEIIKIFGPIGGDEYWFEYDDSKEKVPIFISNADHALLVNSKKFGRNDIFIISPNTFRIGSEIFDRKT
jgi:hypothetical protein